MDGGERVGSEFVGMARATRHGYIASAVLAGKQMRAIIATMQAGYKGKSTAVSLRTLQRAADAWRQVDRAGCLRQEIKLRGKRLQIADLRANGSFSKQPNWATEEIGVCLVGNLVDAKPLGMFWREPLLAALSLHALARWYQRAMDNSRPALENDLRVIAEASQDVVAERHANAAVPTNNGGAWYGSVADDGTGQLFLSIRSFF